MTNSHGQHVCIVNVSMLTLSCDYVININQSIKFIYIALYNSQKVIVSLRGTVSIFGLWHGSG